MKAAAEVAEEVRTKFREAQLTRARVSAVSIAKLAGVKKLHPIWVTQFIDALALLGLLAGIRPDGGFALIQTDSLSGSRILRLTDEDDDE